MMRAALGRWHSLPGPRIRRGWALGRRPHAATTFAAFALLAPAIMLIFFGTMEGGRVLRAWIVVTNEAREAARYGSVRYDSTRDPSSQAADVSTYLTNRVGAILPTAYLRPAPVVKVTSDGRVSVTAYYEVPLVIPLVSKALPHVLLPSGQPAFPLKAESVMRGE